MDSLTQIALGAAVSVAVMGRRTAVWKAALWGGLAGTLPDLDVLIDQGDPVRNMVLHRAESHALFWLSLVSWPIGSAVAWWHQEWNIWRRWWLAIWLVLVTHPLLDALTIYGTQLALPFSDHPFGLGSVFIIDPAYTLPLLLGVGCAVAARGRSAGLRINAASLVLSTAYLAWSVVAQQHVERAARSELAAQGIAFDRLLVTPAPFSTLLWRVVAIDAQHYHEAYHGLLDREPHWVFDRFDRSMALAQGLQDAEALGRIAAFSKGFFRLDRQGERIRVADLRMGQEPSYIFTFEIGQVVDRARPPLVLLPPVQVGVRPDLARGLPWLWRRMQGEMLAPPR